MASDSGSDSAFPQANERETPCPPSRSQSPEFAEEQLTGQFDGPADGNSSSSDSDFDTSLDDLLAQKAESGKRAASAAPKGKENTAKKRKLGDGEKEFVKEEGETDEASEADEENEDDEAAKAAQREAEEGEKRERKRMEDERRKELEGTIASLEQEIASLQGQHKEVEEEEQVLAKLKPLSKGAGKRLNGLVSAVTLENGEKLSLDEDVAATRR